MNRREVITSGSVLLLGAISGCLSGSDDEPPDPRAGDEVAISEFSFPEGFGEDEVDDEAWLNPERSLDGIESLTVTVNQEVTAPETHAEMEVVNQANRVQKRYKSDVRSTYNGDLTLFHWYGTEHRRITKVEHSDAEVTYDDMPIPFEFELASGYNTLLRVWNGRSFTVDRVTEVDDKRFAFYRWVGGNPDPLMTSPVSIRFVIDVSLEAIIDEAGIIYEIDGSWDFEDEQGESGRATVHYETSNIDDTTVDEPAWLEEALDELGLQDIGDERIPSTPSYIGVPSAAFTVDEDPDNFTITFTHAGGESINRATLSVRGSAFADVEHLGTGEFSAGDELTVHIFPDGPTRGTELRLIWEHPELDETRVLRTYTFRREFDSSVDED